MNTMLCRWLLTVVLAPIAHNAFAAGQPITLATAGCAKAYVSIAGFAERIADNLQHQRAGKLTGELATRNEVILSSLQQGHLVNDVAAPLLTLYRPSGQP